MPGPGDHGSPGAGPAVGHASGKEGGVAFDAGQHSSGAMNRSPRRGGHGPIRVFGTEAPVSAADLELITSDNQEVILRNQEGLLQRLTKMYDEVHRMHAQRREELRDVHLALKAEKQLSRAIAAAARVAGSPSPRKGPPSAFASPSPGGGASPAGKAPASDKLSPAPAPEASAAYFAPGEEPSGVTVTVTVPLAAEATATSLAGGMSTAVLERQIREFQSGARPRSHAEIHALLAAVEHHHTEVAFKNFMWERLLERTGREIVQLQKQGGDMQAQVHALESELVRLHDEVRNTRLATRDMRRSLADQEARNREAREGHDRQLREAEGALRSDEAVQELLRLPNEQMHALAALMDPAPPSPRAAPQANPSPAKVDTNRTTMKWLLQDRRPESAGTKERKRLAARADVAFEDLGTRTGIHDPEELGEYIVEKLRAHREGHARQVATAAEAKRERLESQLNVMRRMLLVAKTDAAANATDGAASGSPASPGASAPGPAPDAAVADRLRQAERRSEFHQRVWAGFTARMLALKGGLAQVQGKLRRVLAMAQRGGSGAEGEAEAGAGLPVPGGDGEELAAENRDLVDRIVALAEEVVGAVGPGVLDSLVQAQRRRYSEAAEDGVEHRMSEAGSRASSRAVSRAESRAGMGPRGSRKHLLSDRQLAAQLGALEEERAREGESEAGGEVTATPAPAPAVSPAKAPVAKPEVSPRGPVPAVSSTSTRESKLTASGTLVRRKKGAAGARAAGSPGPADVAERLVGATTYEDASDEEDRGKVMGTRDKRWIQWRAEFERIEAERRNAGKHAERKVALPARLRMADAAAAEMSSQFAAMGVPDVPVPLASRSTGARRARPKSRTRGKSRGRSRAVSVAIAVAAVSRAPSRPPASPGSPLRTTTKSRAEDGEGEGRQGGGKKEGKRVTLAESSSFSLRRGISGPYTGYGSFEKNQIYQRMETLEKRLRKSVVVAQVLDDAEGDGDDNDEGMEGVW